MIRKPLITIADIRQFYPLGDLPAGRLDQYIMEAQFHELRPLMNDALYTDFITKYDAPADTMYSAYGTLLSGANYLYAGRTIEYPGLKPILVYYTLARLITDNPVSITAYGVTVKKVSESDPVDRESLERMAIKFRAKAIAYGEELKKYLYININTYILYGYKYSSSQVNRQGFGIF